MPGKKTREVKSNLRRCPLLKITKRTVSKDGTEETIEEFNDCYMSYCMAWDNKQQCCTYFSFDLAEATEDDDDD